MPLLDKLREQYGVGPVCSELHIAPSTYYHCQQQRHHPDKRSARAQRDDWLKREIQRVYGVIFRRTHLDAFSGERHRRRIRTIIVV